MSRPVWQMLSLILNVTLAGIVWKEWNARRTAGISPFFRQAIAQRAVQPLAAPPAPTPTVVAAVAEISEPFSWQSVETTDYGVFIKNLRAIGCPDLTIYDIVSAEVDDLFNARVKGLVDGVTGNFWTLIISSKNLEDLVDGKQKELEALRDQKSKMLSALFGEINLADEYRAAQSEIDRLALEKSRLDFLSGEKRAMVLEIQNRFAAARAALQNSGTNFTATERKQKNAALETQRQKELRTLLTPAEHEEYRLRTGDAADHRQPLTGFDGTDEEFRAIALAKMNSKSDEPIRELLGPERFAAYQRAQDNDYLQTLRVTDRFELPEESAAQIYQMQRDALALAKQIRNDNSRTDEERQALLLAIREETERSINGVLGPAASAVYREHAGSWMGQLVK